VTRFDFTAPPVHGNPKIQSWINEIDLATGSSLTEPVLAKASDLGVAEGCHILKKDGWYYFFTAEGGTQGGHRECVYRSKSPLGPFDPPPEGVNPVIFNDDHPDIQNTGHMDLIEGDDGKWIAVFLGVRPVFKARNVSGGAMGMPTHLGRESFMAPVEWIDGWPVVNSRKPIELLGHAEGLTLLPEKAEWRDDFETSGEFTIIMARQLMNRTRQRLVSSTRTAS
jgi:beta-xylosidase